MSKSILKKSKEIVLPAPPHLPPKPNNGSKLVEVKNETKRDSGAKFEGSKKTEIPKKESFNKDDKSEDEEEEEESSSESSESDEDETESQNGLYSPTNSARLKLKCLDEYNYESVQKCFQVSLSSLLFLFQLLMLVWIALAVYFQKEEMTFGKEYFGIDIYTQATVEIFFHLMIGILGTLQILQKGSYDFVHNARLAYHVTIGAYVSHLVVFICLSFYAFFRHPRKLREKMLRELGRIRRGKGKMYLWENSHKKFQCCGLGIDNSTEEEFVFNSCCQNSEKLTNPNTCPIRLAYKKSCIDPESEFMRNYIIVSMILLGIGLIFSFFLYLGFRFFRPYWKFDPNSLKIKSLTNAITDHDLGIIEEAELKKLQSVSVMDLRYAQKHKNSIHNSINNKNKPKRSQ